MKRVSWIKCERNHERKRELVAGEREKKLCKMMSACNRTCEDSLNFKSYCCCCCRWNQRKAFIKNEQSIFFLLSKWMKKLDDLRLFVCRFQFRNQELLVRLFSVCALKSKKRKYLRNSKRLVREETLTNHANRKTKEISIERDFELNNFWIERKFGD